MCYNVYQKEGEPMNKSVYSLVLADEVVEAIDRMAYSMNTSRSNLINQILADHHLIQDRTNRPLFCIH